MKTVFFEDERQFEESPQRVVFYAKLGERTLRCLIARKTLEDHFTILGPPHARVKDCLAIFDHHRSRIRESARRLIEEMGANDLDSVSEVVLSPATL